MCLKIPSGKKFMTKVFKRASRSFSRVFIELCSLMISNYTVWKWQLDKTNFFCPYMIFSKRGRRWPIQHHKNVMMIRFFFSVFTNKESLIIFRESHKDMLFCMRCCSRSVASFLREMIFLHAPAKKSFIIYSSSVDDPKLRPQFGGGLRPENIVISCITSSP